MCNNCHIEKGSTREEIENASQPLRIPAYRKLAKKQSTEVFKELNTLVRGVNIWLSQQEEAIANSNLQLEKDFGLEDMIEYLLPLLGVFGNELDVLDLLIGEALDKIRDIFSKYAPKYYQEGLDETYRQIAGRKVNRSDPRFKEVPEVYSTQRDIVRLFVSDGLERITSKLTIDHKTRIYQTIYNGLVEGKNHRKIASEMLKMFGGERYHWTRLIRTEAQIAYYNAYLERSEQAGIEYEKLSVARNACPICRHYLGENGKGLYRFGEGPPVPIHPNCRCSYVPFFRLPSGGQDVLLPTYQELTREEINTLWREERARLRVGA